MDFPELNKLRTVTEIRARVSELEDTMTRMNLDAAGIPFTVDQANEFGAMAAERDEAIKRIDELEARERMIAEFSTREANTETASFFTAAPGSTRAGDIFDLTTVDRTTPEREWQDMHNRALTFVETAQFPSTEARDNVGRLLDENDASGELARRILITGSPIYKRAFGKYIANKARTPEEERALSTATNYAVPVTIDPTVILTSNGVINPVRQVARVITITGNAWTGVASTGVTASYGVEGPTEVGDNTPALTQPAANVETARAFIKYPIEVGDDWGALQSEMARLFADAKDTLESSKFLGGLGHASAEPEGLLVGATGTQLTSANTLFAIGDLYALIENLAPRWRARASFAGNLATYNKIRQFDTAGGAAMWVQLGAGRPGVLLGQPAIEWSDYSSATTTSNASLLTYGDFNEFTIVDRVGMNVEAIPHIFATANNRPSGERGLFAYWRNTSDVRTAAAFRTIKIR